MSRAISATLRAVLGVQIGVRVSGSRAPQALGGATAQSDPLLAEPTYEKLWARGATIEIGPRVSGLALPSGRPQPAGFLTHSVQGEGDPGLALAASFQEKGGHVRACYTSAATVKPHERPVGTIIDIFA